MRVSVFLGFLAAVAAAPFSLRAADEASLLGEVDAQALERHARAIVMHPRDGGSPGENAAVDYVVETLRADGIDVEVHVFPGYVSNPGRCALRVEGAEPSEPTCLTQAHSASTPQSGVSGELVYVGGGTPSDYENVDVEGKVVLVNALPLPWGVKDAEDRGAVGAVFIFIGQTPNSHLLKGLVELDEGGHARVDLRMQTTVPGLFVAGDLRVEAARQLVSACGDGATAALAAEAYLAEAGIGEG